MKNKIITIIQILLVLTWAILTWGIEPVAWNIPTGFINVEQAWGLLAAMVTIVPAISMQKIRDKNYNKKYSLKTYINIFKYRLGIYKDPEWVNEKPIEYHWKLKPQVAKRLKAYYENLREEDRVIKEKRGLS